MSLYITVDGPSGTGKGAISKWLYEYFNNHKDHAMILRDNRLDPLREHAAKIVPWCKKRGLDPKTFLLPLFAAGYQISEQEVARLLGQGNTIIRDRSFISALAYQTSSRKFQPDEIWDLCVHYLGLQVPDCAVIVDCDVDVALERIKRRSQNDVGLGGKMSSGRTQHELVTNRFRELVATGYWKPSGLNICYVYNNGPFSDDPAVIQAHMNLLGGAIIGHMEKTGVIR